MVKKIMFLIVLILLISCGGATSMDDADPPAVEAGDELVEQSAPLVKETETVDGRETAVPPLQPVDPEDSPVLAEDETLVVTPDDKETPEVNPANKGESMMNTAAEVQQALSNELDIPVNEIEIVQEMEVTWPDGALGCPQPGVNYMQVLMPGRQLILQASGQIYHYHAAATGAYQFCANPQPPVENPSGGLSSNQAPPEGVND